MHIRQLEFALLQLTEQVDKLFNAVQFAIQGKLSIEFVNPEKLHSILRNVSLHLQEGYELIAGTHINNVHLYYELTEVSVVANTNCIHLILHVPLQTTERHYTLFRLITLPICVTADKFVRYSVDYTYFGLQHNQQTYLLLTEAGYSRCNKGNVVICKADIAVYDSQTNTCESSFFFKAEGTHPLCRRKLLVHQNTPSLQRYGAIWVYQFAKQQRVTLRCTKADAQLPHTLTLEGTGLLRNLTGCRITSTELHTFPELHGSSDERIEPPMIYLPDNISVLDSHELQQIRDMPLPNLQKLDDIYSRVTAAQHTYDLDAVMHIHQTSLRQTQQTNWVVIPLTSMVTITTLSVLLYFLCNRFRNSYCIICKSKAAAPPSQPPIEPSKSHNEASTSSEKNASSNVVFASYASQQSK